EFVSLISPDSATTDVSTRSLHDALPISGPGGVAPGGERPGDREARPVAGPRLSHRGAVRAAGGRHLREPARLSRRPTRTKGDDQDRKSTRLNSSHVKISYAVFCLTKKKQ